MEILSFAELIEADERTLRFTPLGIGPAGALSPEGAAQFEQQEIAAADLVEAVPEGVRSSFERLRRLHAYGVLWYDAFTIATDLSLVVLEQAMRDRFVEFYGGVIPVVKDVGGDVDAVSVRDFAALRESVDAAGRPGKRWQLRLAVSGDSMDIPRSLKGLLAWARREGLLQHSSDARVDRVLVDIRNRFAHGAGYHLLPPNWSAERICSTAGIINELWGSPTSRDCV